MKKVHKKRLRQAISSILAAAMSLSLFTTIPASAEVGKKTYRYDGYSVDYNVTNEWDGAQTVELTVSNTGTDSILNWALKYDAEGEISNLWNASLYEQNGDEYVIKNAGWNFEIAPSQSVTYGYTLSGNDLTLPKSFEFYSKRVDKTEGYDVKYNITKSWDAGVEGNIVITNTSAAPIEAWSLSFDSNFTISSLWNGRVLENNGTFYTVAAEMWTNPIQPNGSMTIGFVGSKAADVEALLSNFKLTEVVVGEGGVVAPDPKLEITANAIYDKENGKITVSWLTNKADGSFEIFVSVDGEKYTSVGVVEGTAEFVYTPKKDFETLYIKVVQIVGEQAAESKAVKVSGSEADLAIIAAAYYDKDSSNIKVMWITNNENGTFEVFKSDDNESFTSLGTVENTKAFIYTPDGEFEVLYFKVKQTMGTEFVESESTEVYYPIDWEDDTDTDNDGLTDVYEKYYFETDPTNPDTDGDGLPDGYEFYYLGTDPTKTDTDDNGISDGYEDFDNDGLSNLREYELGTDPNSEDSDFDGITDGEELNKYNTNPLKVDTDDDGVTDKDEVDLGLDPTSTSTDGIPDNEHTFEQSVGADTENFASVNTDENPFKVSVDVTAAGVAANNLYADESGYSAFVSNEAILGITPEFFYNDKLKVEKITINFDIDSDYVANTNGKYVSVSDEFVGIKRFNVFKYFDDINMLLPIETFHDVANNRVYANVDEMGTYCLIDMEIWFEKLGIEPKAAEPQVMALSTDETSDLKVSNDENLDVVFVLYSSSSYIKHIKSELITTIEDIFKEAEERNVSARIHYVTWTGDVYLNTATGEYFAENLEDATAMINRSLAIDTTMLYPSDYVLTKAISGIKNNVCGNLQENSKKYSFIVDAGCNPTCSSVHYGIQALQKQGFDFSFIYAPGNHNISNYNAISSNNSCFQIQIKPGRMMFSDFVIEHIFAEEEAIIIKSNDFERFPDDFGEISTTSTQDYDGDGVLDVDEIDWETINMYSQVNSSMSISLPKYKVLAASKNANVDINRYLRSYDFNKDIDKITVVPVEADPTDKDSDKDGFDDWYESNYGSKHHNLRVMYSDDTTVKDAAIDDSHFFDEKDSYISGTYVEYAYENVEETKTIRTELIYEGGTTKNGDQLKTMYNKNLSYKNKKLSFNRKYHSTKAKYILTPEEDSDYIIKVSLPKQSKAYLTITEKNFWGKYVNVSNRKDIINEIVPAYLSENGERYDRMLAQLKGGKSYCFEITNLDVNADTENTEYKITFEQDNWVYAPDGASASFKMKSDSKYSVYIPSYMIEKMYFDENDDHIYSVSERILDSHCTRATGSLVFNDDYLKQNEAENELFNSISMGNTYASPVVIILTDAASAVVGAIVTSFGVSSSLAANGAYKNIEKYKEQIYTALKDGEVNIVYSFRYQDDPVCYNQGWNAWNKYHCVNKYSSLEGKHCSDDSKHKIKLFRQNIEVGLKYYTYLKDDYGNCFWELYTMNPNP